MPRNPILAKSFRAVKLAENAGFGFDKMMNGWKSYKGIEPVFDIHIDATIVTFPLQINDVPETDDEKGGIKGGIKGSIKGSIKGDEKGSTEGNVKIGKKRLTKKQREVLELIKINNTISIEIAATKLEINRSAAQKRFEILKNNGIIIRESGKSGGFWKVLIDL